MEDPKASNDMVLGQLMAKVDRLHEDVRTIKTDVEGLKTQRAQIVGVGATLSFGLAAVGFFFGDGFRLFVRKFFQ